MPLSHDEALPAVLVSMNTACLPPTSDFLPNWAASTATRLFWYEVRKCEARLPPVEELWTARDSYDRMLGTRQQEVPGTWRGPMPSNKTHFWRGIEPTDIVRRPRGHPDSSTPHTSWGTVHKLLHKVGPDDAVPSGVDEDAEACPLVQHEELAVAGHRILRVCGELQWRYSLGREMTARG